MAQAAMIEDAIIGIKRTLARQNPEAGLDEPVTQPTNRGNKLRANAKYVHEGALGCMNGKEFYRKKAEHAGYKRDILEFNPPRYDSEGDELDFDDSDANADAEAAEDNPYADIFLQDILGPLKRPSELADHPSMRHTYTSPTLKRMVDSVEKRLREERSALVQAKTLHRQLLGDAAWIPCGVVETEEDDDLFTCSAEQWRGYDASSSILRDETMPAELMDDAEFELQENAPGSMDNKQLATVQNDSTPGHEGGAEDVEMADAEDERDRGDNSRRQEDPSKPNMDLDGEPQERSGFMEATADSMAVNGESKPKPERSDTADAVMDDKPDNLKESTTDAVENSKYSSHAGTEAKPEVEGEDHRVEAERDNEEAIDDRSPEPPRRMTTRAQANQGTNFQQHQGSTNASTPSLSGTLQSASDADSLPLNVHPLFLLPTTLNFDRTCGVPQQEADETRQLLWAYIQKQESTVRLFSEMLDLLLKAYRMKEDVWEWCKAEGHLGEMSDGEDWYDREKLGLAEGETLRKGADEDEADADDGKAAGKRSRRRN